MFSGCFLWNFVVTNFCNYSIKEMPYNTSSPITFKDLSNKLSWPLDPKWKKKHDSRRTVERSYVWILNKKYAILNLGMQIRTSYLTKKNVFWYLNDGNYGFMIIKIRYTGMGYFLEIFKNCNNSSFIFSFCRVIGHLFIKLF